MTDEEFIEMLQQRYKPMYRPIPWDVDLTTLGVKDMMIIGMDEDNLPMFDPVIEAYVQWMMDQPIGSLKREQEKMIEKWVAARSEPIRQTYIRYGEAADGTSNISTRFAALGWRDVPSDIMSYERKEEIYQMHKDGMMQKAIAEKLNLAKSTVQGVCAEMRKIKNDPPMSGLPFRE